MSLITRTIVTSGVAYKDAEAAWDDCMAYISPYMKMFEHMTVDQREDIQSHCDLIDKIVKASHLVVGVGRVD